MLENLNFRVSADNVFTGKRQLAGGHCTAHLHSTDGFTADFSHTCEAEGEREREAGSSCIRGRERAEERTNGRREGGWKQVIGRVPTVGEKRLRGFSHHMSLLIYESDK